MCTTADGERPTLGEGPAIDRTNILGVGVSAVNMETAVSRICAWIAARTQHYVCVCDVHSVIECQRDPDLKRILNRSGLTTPDGMPLVWISRFYGKSAVDRVYGPDLLLALCERSVHRGYRHYFFGGTDGVATILAQRLSTRFPGLQVVGTYTPPFGSPSDEEDRLIVETIESAKPDIVWVGLSNPKQERWMAAHIGRISAPVLIGIGAAFDFHSGRVKQSPRWIQRSGFEWLYRLAREPRRLLRRYATCVPAFVALIILQLTGLRRFDIPKTVQSASDPEADAL